VQLVLTDLVLPGMGGRELASRIRGTYPDIRILYTSGYTDDAVIRDVLEFSPEHFIGKPYTRAELTGRVRDLLDSPVLL
jgi:DNA-binding NarL/FixJ family response regulator